MGTKVRIGAAACLLVGSILVMPTAAGSAPPSQGAHTAPALLSGPGPGVSPTVVSAAPDYFTDTWADPMDFSNQEDFDTSGRRSPGINTSLSNGALNYSQWWSAGRLYFADSAPNELVVTQHRQSTHRPVDTARLTRLAVRAYTDRDIVGAIVWDRCAGTGPPGGCLGVKTFWLRSGWHTYDLDLRGTNDGYSHVDASRPNSLSGVSWSGAPVVRLGWQPSYGGVSGVNGVIDWVRLYQPGMASANVTNPGGAANLWHDGDANSTNNGTATNQAVHAGVLRKNLPAGTSRVELGALPPGSYRFETEVAGSFSEPSGAVVVDRAPMPVVLDPDVAGGGDWFEATRGRALDFSHPSDLWRMFDGSLNVRNANAGIWGDWLHASSAGRRDDPQVFLTDAFWNGPVLDAEEWHRVTWNIQYEGTWGTNAVPGEGLDTRFCWFVANGPASCSKDVFPELGPQTYSVDLKTANPADVENAGYSGVGFGGPRSRWVHLLRLDPHEDPGPRTWHLDNVRIAHDDRIPFGGSFPIRFVDNAHQPGSVAEVFVDRDPWLSNGASRIARVNVRAGENRVNWSGAGFAPGLYTVHVRITDPTGGVRHATSTGPLDLPSPAKWSPMGAMDTVAVRPGRQIYVAGWTLDPDWVRDPTRVHVYIDGVPYDVLANRGHEGIGRMRTDAGPWHGFEVAVGVAPGNHSVCAYAINFGYGNHTPLGCRNVVVK